MTNQRLDLTAEERDRARALWNDGKSLGEIADALGCSAYALSPWLYADDMRKAREQARRREGQ